MVLSIKFADVIIVNVLEQNLYMADDLSLLFKQILKIHAKSHRK
jgi:hypothetical protein